jgi:hypothetical protein
LPNSSRREAVRHAKREHRTCGGSGVRGLGRLGRC